MLRVTFRVLGALEAENPAGPINLRGSRQRAVLARLLIGKGRTVPATWLIDDLWSDAPEGALGAVQTFIGGLRKALEPDRPPRTPSRLLVTVPPGYALRVAPEAVDAWRFETGAVESARLLSTGRARDALAMLDEMLALWRGPAYAEFADLDWARVEVARLEELRLLAVGRRAEAAMALGQVAESVADLQVLVAGQPLREEGWRLLALALYRAGRQGDALATLRKARESLLGELGLDPGPRLRQMESDILAQSAHLLVSPAVEAVGPGSPVAVSEMRTGPARHPFVGRSAELATVQEAAAATIAAGRPGLLLLSGAAGAGKTALITMVTDDLDAAGWLTAWGTSPEVPGAPAAWAWTQIRDRLTAAGFDPTLRGDDDEGEEPFAARFRRHRAIGSSLASVAAISPVLLVFDDLHWADEETLALLTALSGDQEVGPVLIVGTYRSTEIGAGLAQALSRAARTEPTRLYLSGLADPEIREMLAAITSREMTARWARVVEVRSAGNPFFVRELARLWETGGDAALMTVPEGVRDVIRHRLSGLPAAVKTHLRQAAVIGPEVDIDSLIALAGNEELVLESIECAVLTGFLVEADQARLWFEHALVQEAIYDDIPRARRAGWHAAAATIIEQSRPNDVEAIAHHLLRAGRGVDAGRTARYASAAARRAEHRFAPQAASELWRAAISALDSSASDSSGAATPRTRLDALMGLVRSLAIGGDLQQAREHRADAVARAEALGDPVLTASVLGSFDVPAIWTTNDDEALSARLVATAERTLAELGASRHADRARLLITIAMERRADTGPRGDQAAGEAERIARDLNDPTLLALALNGRFLHAFKRAGLAPERAQLGAELLDLANDHGGLVTFQVLGHLIIVQARAALADFDAADRHAGAADLLAVRYDLPLIGVFTDWYRALRLAVTGQLDAARFAYRKAAGRLSGTGMFGIEAGILPLAMLCLDETHAFTTRESAAAWGPFESWVRPLMSLGQGDRNGALAALRHVPESPRDLLFELRTCIHALAAIRLEERSTMMRLYNRLLPAKAELAGAGSGLLTLGPTAQYLGDLAAALGRTQQAGEHYSRALAVAEKAGAPQWVAAARRAMERLGGEQHSATN